MKNNKRLQTLAYVGIIAGLGVAAWFTREHWLPLFDKSGSSAESTSATSPSIEPSKTLKLSEQARANLQLVSRPVKIEAYWKRLQIAGVIVDRPGITDQGITSPISGVVIKVHKFEGDIVEPGEKLFSLRIVSEYLQKSQSDLFRAVRETEILNTELDRLRQLANSGAIPGKRILELEQQVSRQTALLETFRQDLKSRGLTTEQVQQIESGNLLSTIDIHAPAAKSPEPELVKVGSVKTKEVTAKDFFELQNLKIELGQQVDNGQTLAILANHQSLYIKGHAFKKEASSLARAAESDWPVDIEFSEDVAKDWESFDQKFHIRHLANTTDPNSRTFDFFVPLTNQSRVFEKEDRTIVVWRYRPGQRVVIDVPVEKLEQVIVLPKAAVVFEGPEAFVFQQDGDLFNRIPVQVLHQDRNNIVITNDGTLSPGFYLAQSSAAALNRVLKSQGSSGMPTDVHVHADGTSHGAH